MKKIYLILIFLVSQVSRGQSQSYEMGGPTGKDTINLIDVLGKKQGKWIIKGKLSFGSDCGSALRCKM